MLLSAKAKSAINALYTGRINKETIGDIKEQVETIEIGTGKFIIMQHQLMNAASGYEARISLLILVTWKSVTLQVLTLMVLHSMVNLDLKWIPNFNIRKYDWFIRFIYGS